MDDSFNSPIEKDEKLNKIIKLLDIKKLDIFILQRVSSIAWLTGGADTHVNTAVSDGAATILITLKDAYIFTNNIEAPRLLKEEGLENLQWKFIVNPWYKANEELENLTHGKKIGHDGLFYKGVDLSNELSWLRANLTENEVARFRILASACAESMQEAIENVQPGMSEYQIAARLADKSEARGVQAVVNLVATDERIFSFRHPLPSEKKLTRYAMLILCGRKWGLICSITRLVYFGKLPQEIRAKAEAVANIDAAMIAATRPGKTLADVFQEAQDGYQKYGYPGEWQKHHQGGVAGYEPREITATPDTNQPIHINQVYAWNPSIAGAKSEDSILIGKSGNEILTNIPGWPMIEITIGSKIIKRPAIWERQ